MLCFKKIAIYTTVGLISLCIHLTGHGQSTYKNLVWSDEFSKDGLPDSTKWGYDVGKGCPDNCGWGNNELEYYTVKRKENARVEKGMLIIESRKELSDSTQYTSARLQSKNNGGWKYGRFEIKAKIPRGKGIWPAIWMLPSGWEYGPWPHSGEIDIMENVGYWPDTVFSTVHTGKYNGSLGTQKSKGTAMPDFSKAFHVYAMEWTAGELSFFIDGKKFFGFKNDNSGTEAWPFNKAFHLMLNVAVGGNWGGKYGVDESIFPQKMEIDYVRVYQ